MKSWTTEDRSLVWEMKSGLEKVSMKRIWIIEQVIIIFVPIIGIIILKSV